MASDAHVMSLKKAQSFLVWFRDKCWLGEHDLWATPPPNISHLVVTMCGDLISFLCVEVARRKGRLTLLLHGWHCHLATPNSGGDVLSHPHVKKGLTANLDT
ncbi:hypothetical protein HU200_033434 [Digitaria exilis]|uniref:Uncharacterized protein n=1 Tax=Digitaria exilis TaxID=1010633 RepID=A0A835BM15_9POAL|nr:hypothetical protein HU200_033434 [Digitaria exilis]